MTLQYSVPVRNARLDAVESTIGTSAIMRIRTGAQPATCATADSGTILATLNLPSDWMAAAATGAKAKAGTWEDLIADNSGTAAHFRIYDSGGTVCGMQGSIGVGSGDLQVDSVAFTAGQPFTVTAFTLTAGNP